MAVITNSILTDSMSDYVYIEEDNMSFCLEPVMTKFDSYYNIEVLITIFIPYNHTIQYQVSYFRLHIKNRFNKILIKTKRCEITMTLIATTFSFIFPVKFSRRCP